MADGSAQDASRGPWSGIGRHAAPFSTSVRHGLLQWQPPLCHSRIMPSLVEPCDLRPAQQAMISFAKRTTSDLFVPDGVIPSGLTPILLSLGCPTNAVNDCLMRLVASQLDTVVRGSQSLLLWTADLWQALGSPMRGFGPAYHQLSACTLCGRECSPLDCHQQQGKPSGCRDHRRGNQYILETTRPYGTTPFGCRTG